MALVTSTKGCFHCENSCSAGYKDGWRLRSGKFAQLCNRCGSLYEEGRFCDAFHSKDEGWRDCESCGKSVHCGCIASFNTYMLLDFGGVICMSCSRTNFIMARRRCLVSGIQMFSETQADDHMQIDPLYRPRVTDAELQEISRKINSAVVPLFEKFLSVGDADQTLGRLVIPKSCAEAFFPEISQHGCPMKMLDTEGREWAFQFRYWLNNGSKMFVLEGLREYMASMQWQPGDLVNFYRVESDNKLVIGSRKTSGGLSSGEIRA